MAARRRSTTMPEERQLGFSIYTYGEDLIEDNARDKMDVRYGEPEFRSQVLKRRLMTADGKITERGWEVLNRDVLTLERNAMAWLRRTFRSAVDHGHDSYGDLVGYVWASLADREQRKLVMQVMDGLDEKVELDDVPDAFKGVSEFGRVVLGGAINFEKP